MKHSVTRYCSKCGTEILGLLSPKTFVRYDMLTGEKTEVIFYHFECTRYVEDDFTENGGRSHDSYDDKIQTVKTPWIVNR